MADENLTKIYADASVERDGYTDAILDTKSKNVVVVAGPGTGKTTLFAKLLTKRGGQSLTLSFINALVDDLSLGLIGLSEVRTLHGFSASILGKEADAKIFPKLPIVIKEDALMMLGQDINFDEIFHACEGEETHIAFYKARKDYYGRYYGFGDAIYGLVKFFETYPKKVPSYNQIVVDEFQDFNKAEVSLINLLAKNSPILIAGDDDQSLYIDLKQADPAHIREMHGPTRPEYVSFPLPFCSRSTRVIVEAVNDVVEGAQKQGLLKGRVRKQYKYFPSKEKDRECESNPRLICRQMHDTQIASYIVREMYEIAEQEREKFSVLIVIPPQLKKLVMPKLGEALEKKGLRNVIYADSTAEKSATLIEALKILLENQDDNLGWRIIAKCLLSSEDFKALLLKCDGANRVRSFIPEETQALVKRLLRTLKKVRDKKTTEKEALDELISNVGYDPIALTLEALRRDYLADEEATYEAHRGIRSVPVTITTIPSSKGLAADYVFITHFDDRYYGQAGTGTITDRQVFSFLVALTRARKRAYLISPVGRVSKLLKWIDKNRIEGVSE
jgi:superfamily I DNA/RNA helicase